MKPLEQNEIFQNLSGFLKTRGIELKEGSYAKGIQKSCALLTNAINIGQESLGRAKVELDKTMEHVRKVIHEKTAPKASPSSAVPPVIPKAKTSDSAKPSSKAGKSAQRARKGQGATSRKGRR